MSRTLGAPAHAGQPTATAGDGQATVSWSAPDDGGSTITKYTVTPYIGATAQTPKDVTGSPAGHEHDDLRADQRDRLHLQGQRDERRRHERAVGGLRSGDPGRARRGCAGLRPAGQQARRGREPGAAADGRRDHGQPPDRAGRRVELRQGHRVGRDRLGRQHLHQADVGQGVRRHRAQRVERADHGRRRHAARRSPSRPRAAPTSAPACSSTRALSTAAGTGVVDALEDRDGHDQCGRQRVLRERPRRAPPPASWRWASTPTRASATRSPATRPTRCAPTCRPPATWSCWPRTAS